LYCLLFICVRLTRDLINATYLTYLLTYLKSCTHTHGKEQKNDKFCITKQHHDIPSKCSK